MIDILDEDYFNRVSSDMNDEIEGEFGLWSLVQVISFELSEDPPEFLFDQIAKLCFDPRTPQDYLISFI